MSYSTTSKYVQLAPYLVMEYMYASQPNPESYFVNSGSPAVGFNKLINGITLTPQGVPTNDPQIYNLNQDYPTTQNTDRNSVVHLGDENFVTLDSGLIVPFNDFNSKLTPSVDLQINFPSNISVIYDSIRYHILAGYNLENTDGLILSVKYPDVDGSLVVFSQIRINKGASQEYTLDPAPLTIGSNIFDKYFEVKIPSLLAMNNQFAAAAAPNKPNTLAGKTSKSGNGFVTGAPIRIEARQIVNTTLINNYPTFGTEIIAQLSLESQDQFGNLGAYIEPSEAGEFFEYFATDSGGFAENFILFQNSLGNSYYIDNKIETFEQIGAALILTSNFSSIQTTAYDIPNLFRPIVRYSANASSFTLRYTMTLVNSKDQSRIVRIASFTSNNPGQYGTLITPISLQVLPQVQKIYNKVGNQPLINVGQNGQDFIPPREIVKYSNVFIERNLVNATTTNLIVANETLTQTDTGVEQPIAYAVGQSYIQISPFDNYFKFCFYKRTGGTLQLLDLTSSGTFSMVFLDNQNKKVFAPSIENINIANSAKGELAFKVDETTSTQILQFTNRRFYISNRQVQSTNKISTFSNGKARLAARSFALDDSIQDVVLSSAKERDTKASLLSNTTSTNRIVIPSDSSSVLYWGNWIKEGEPIPVRTGVNPNVYQTQPPIGGGSLIRATNRENRALQKRTPAEESGDSSSTSSQSSNTPRPTLTVPELKSAISSDAQGKITQGMGVEGIINYFLNPSAVGFRLYVGITKQILIDAVSGILTEFQLGILNSYGNTGGGQTTGGTASAGGASSSQNSESTTEVVIIPTPSVGRGSGGGNRPGNQDGRPRN